MNCDMRANLHQDIHKHNLTRHAIENQTKE